MHASGPGHRCSAAAIDNCTCSGSSVAPTARPSALFLLCRQALDQFADVQLAVNLGLRQEASLNSFAPGSLRRWHRAHVLVALAAAVRHAGAAPAPLPCRPPSQPFPTAAAAPCARAHRPSLAGAGDQDSGAPALPLLPQDLQRQGGARSGGLQHTAGGGRCCSCVMRALPALCPPSPTLPAACAAPAVSVFPPPQEIHLPATDDGLPAVNVPAILPPEQVKGMRSCCCMRCTAVPRLQLLLTHQMLLPLHAAPTTSCAQRRSRCRPGPPGPLQPLRRAPCTHPPLLPPGSPLCRSAWPTWSSTASWARRRCGRHWRSTSGLLLQFCDTTRCVRGWLFVGDA